MKDLGPSKTILGMYIVCNSEKVLFLSRSRYALKVVEKFEIKGANESKTPMDLNINWNEHEDAIDVSYKEAIGSLMYMSGTRPDIFYCCVNLRQARGKPGQFIGMV